MARNQRQRLFAALAEVSAEQGYRRATVTKVTKRAGVSSKTFYDHFTGLDDCMLVAFWDLFVRLHDHVERVARAEPDPEARPRVGLRSALRHLAGDPSAARLLTIEILAAGPEGARCQHRAIGLFAAMLRRADKEAAPIDPAAVPDADWSPIALATSLIARRLIAGQAETIPHLEAELAPTLRPARVLQP